jgi:hypothetical protein
MGVMSTISSGSKGDVVNFTSLPEHSGGPIQVLASSTTWKRCTAVVQPPRLHASRAMEASPREEKRGQNLVSLPVAGEPPGADQEIVPMLPSERKPHSTRVSSETRVKAHPSSRVGAGPGGSVGVGVGDGVGVAVGVGLGVGVGVGVAAGTGIGEGFGVGTGVDVGVATGRAVAAAVCSEVAGGSAVVVGTGVAVGARVGSGVEVVQAARRTPTTKAEMAAVSMRALYFQPAEMLTIAAL